MFVCMSVQLLVLVQESWLRLMDHSPLPPVSIARQNKTQSKSRYCLNVVHTECSVLDDADSIIISCAS